MRQFYYPKKPLSLTKLKALADRLKAKDSTIKRVTYSAIPGDCLILHR